MPSHPCVSLDYSLSMQSAVGPRGLKEAELAGAGDAVRSAVSAVRERVKRGELGFWELPRDGSLADRIDAFVHERACAFTDVLVLGIGGSSLGGRALVHALASPAELSWATQGRRIHFPDNSDPWLLAELMRHLDPSRTLAVVISKSGGTVETAAQMVVIRDWLARALSTERAREHWVAITDPEKGSLRELAQQERCSTFTVPSNVGGRFSVFSAVGLLPAALAGIDIRALTAGAAAMADRCANEALDENPAAMHAALHFLHHRKYGRAIHVLIPYADALRPFAAWYVQLWAESLGKRVDRSGHIVETGPTPLAAVGATDQHSQLQLFTEGPHDKLLSFVRIVHPTRDITIAASTDPATAYLSGHRMAALLDAELRGTEAALARAGRPSLTWVVDRLDPGALGALMFAYEASTAFSGELYGIDAFNQPGVEESKRLTSGLLGRPGYESARQDVERIDGLRKAQYRVS